VQFADSLYKLCLKVVLKSSDNIPKLFNMSNQDDESTSRMLHRFMIKVHALKDEENDKLCNNCQQFPCLDGSTVALNNFVKNAKVFHNQMQDGVVRLGAIDGYGTIWLTERIEKLRIYTGSSAALVYKCASK